MTHSLICDANNSLNFDITDSRTHRYTKSEMSVEAEMNTFFSKLDTDNSGSITDVQFQVCVAACCSVLQRVAACCSVLQRVVACGIPFFGRSVSTVIAFITEVCSFRCVL